jgi:hypothetical protein
MSTPEVTGHPTVSEVSVSEAVVEAIAEREGISPLEVTPPLYSVVDLEAVEELFHQSSTTGTVSFEYAGYTVYVSADGTVSVTERDD